MRNAELVDRGVATFLARVPFDLAGTATAAGPQTRDAVSRLVLESLLIPAHWDTRDRNAGGALVRREMQRRHPELSELALDVLVEHVAAAWE